MDFYRAKRYQFLPCMPAALIPKRNLNWSAIGATHASFAERA
jgi:hypothetical protein